MRNRALFDSRKIRLLTATCFVCAAACATSLPAHAANGRIGWVWANQPTTASYTPDAAHSYNSRAEANTVTRFSAGVYGVELYGLFDGNEENDVQVSAYDTSGYCQIEDLGQRSAGVTIIVNCYNAGGVAADAQFTVLYQSHSGKTGTGSKGLAYVFLDPDAAVSSYNSTGGTNTIVGSSAGNYTVTLPGLSGSAGNVQVTAVGSKPARCKVSGWGSSGNGVNVGVLCFDGTGAPADEPFSLAYSLADPYAVATPATNYQAYAWTNKPKDHSSYVPSDPYNWSNFKTGRLTAQETRLGHYTVTVPGTLPPYSTSNVLVTSNGGDNSYCNVVSWATSTIDVACYAQGGAPAAEDFDVSFQAWE